MEGARLAGRRALLLRNHAGRRNLTEWSARTGVPLGPRLADALETVIRTINVVVSHARAHRFPGLVVVDRHLYCQLGLRSVRGLPHGRFLPWLLRHQPKPDLVIHFDIAPDRRRRRAGRSAGRNQPRSHRGRTDQRETIDATALTRRGKAATGIRPLGRVNRT